MKSVLTGSAAIVAVALMLGHASAQEGAKGAAGGGAAGAAPAAGAAGGAAGGAGSQELVPPGGGATKGSGEASPGMKPAGSPMTEPGQRKQGENVGESPAKKPVAPGEPAGEQKPTKGETQPANKAQTQPSKQGETQPGKQGETQPSKQGAQQNGGAKAGQARPAPKITSVQQTKIQQSIKTVNVSPVHVDFHIGVGVAVPRTVVLTPLPPAIITIVPEYEGYRFFVIPGRIVIVDPFTFEIVAVLPL